MFRQPNPTRAAHPIVQQPKWQPCILRAQDSSQKSPWVKEHQCLGSMLGPSIPYGATQICSSSIPGADSNSPCRAFRCSREDSSRRWLLLLYLSLSHLWSAPEPDLSSQAPPHLPSTQESLPTNSWEFTICGSQHTFCWHGGLVLTGAGLSINAVHLLAFVKCFMELLWQPLSGKHAQVQCCLGTGLGPELTAKYGDFNLILPTIFSRAPA